MDFTLKISSRNENDFYLFTSFGSTRRVAFKMHCIIQFIKEEGMKSNFISHLENNYNTDVIKHYCSSNKSYLHLSLKTFSIKI